MQSTGKEGATRRPGVGLPHLRGENRPADQPGMTPESTNLYKLDDVLLRTGRIGLALVVLMAAASVMVALEDGGGDAVIRLAWNHGFHLMLALSPPVACLWTGRRIRTRERRVLSIWKVLRRNVQLRVDEFVANSHYSREELDDAVKLLNTRALAHYVHDRSNGLIQDARLRDVRIHVEKCDACSGEISLEVPIGFTRVPACPYCGDPVCVDTLDERRRAVLDRLRGEFAPKTESLGGVPFSIPVFLILMVFCWPAAVGYALYRTYSAKKESAAK